MPPAAHTRLQVMGIVNVTPDSFSDGGRWLDPALAVEHGLRLVADGADILDVGGESTRPGAQPVDEEEELRRVLPVISELAASTGVPISVDTTKARVAAAALEAGATMVNDVSAGRFDAGMFDVVAAQNAAFVAMHMQGEPRTMQSAPRYGDVVAEVTAFLCERVDAAREAGIRDVVVDPGIGFGKTVEHNLTLLGRLADIVAAVAPVPVLVGASRKSFLGRIVDGDPAAHAGRRDDATLATTVWAIEAGAAMVRVHDARRAARAARLLATLATVTPEDVFA